ncbi:hypothetical protein JY651_25360 [Pyxidicoccus parkwayensis]|uniref:Uncharacterized protein n=1 Tax=Pyxidicoccus parkwayensis TaxID=2813578 RepID=A0ABX7NJ68_9BACT|nr:hypothetical protein [Pyxidicoccus parkwaysis]QSQ18693.1 hypothetical protein JY651_25360 [Pyxidicoccus parkwaysis]
MISRTLTVAAALSAALAGAPVLAQSAGASGASDTSDRPDENALFGGESSEPPAEAQSSEERPSDDAIFGGDTAAADTTTSGEPAQQQPSLTEAPPAPGDRDSSALDGPATRNAFDSAEVVDDPLKIGGQFYLRANVAANDGVSFGNTSFSAPTLVDGYFDARPSDRLRGFVVGRLSYDPTLSTEPREGAPSNPRVLLDQAWLRFDLERKVFFTVGKQHVKWGTGQIWNPTDFLSPQRRNPLAFVDLRTGVSMVKLHVPWESRGWNFYGIAVVDDLGTDAGAVTDANGGTTTNAGGSDPVNRLSRIGGALRAEVVLGPAEVGLSGVAQRGRKPRFGLDVSSALGPIDVYGELAIKKGTDRPLYRLPEGTTLQDIFENGIQVESYIPGGLTPQVTGGANYSFPYGENDLAVVGVEYFYNSTGYTSSVGYPYLIAQSAFQPLYVGRHYGAAYLFLNQPFDWDHTSFNFFTLGNLSDRSYTSRLNVTYRALTYLTVEAFGAVHYGRKGGELRLGFTVPDVVVNGESIQGFSVAAPTFELGAGLRISL